jgi:hypothetical protein
LHCEAEKAMKEIKDKEASEDADAIKLLGEDGFKIMTQVINNLYDT